MCVSVCKPVHDSPRYIHFVKCMSLWAQTLLAQNSMDLQGCAQVCMVCCEHIHESEGKPFLT